MINIENEQEESGFNCLYSIKDNWEQRKNILFGIIEEIDENSLDIIEILMQYSKGIALQLTDLRSKIVIITADMLIKWVNKFKNNSKIFFDKLLSESKLYESISSAQKIISDRSHSVILNILKNGIVSFKEMGRIRDLRLNKNKNVRSKVAEYYYYFIIYGIDSSKYQKEILKEVEPLTIDADPNARKFSKNAKNLILNDDNNDKIDKTIKSEIKLVTKKPNRRSLLTKQKTSIDKIDLTNKKKINSNKNIKIEDKKIEKKEIIKDNKKNNTSKYQKKTLIINKDINYDFDKKLSKILILTNSSMPNQKTVGFKKLNKILEDNKLEENQFNNVLKIYLDNLNFKNVELQKLIYNKIFELISNKNVEEKIDILSLNYDNIFEFISKNFEEENFEKGVEFLIDLIIENKGWKFFFSYLIKNKIKSTIINKIKLTYVITENNENILNSEESILFLLEFYKKLLFKDKIQDNKIFKLIGENIISWKDFFIENPNELKEICKNKELNIICRNSKDLNKILVKEKKEIKEKLIEFEEKEEKIVKKNELRKGDSEKLEEVIENSDHETKIAILQGLKNQINKSSTSNQNNKNKIVNKIINIINSIINLTLKNNKNLEEDSIIDLSLFLFKELFSCFKLNNNQINMIFNCLFNILILEEKALLIKFTEFFLTIKEKYILNKILENLSSVNLIVPNLMLFTNLMNYARKNNKYVWFLKEIGNFIEDIIINFQELFENSEAKIRKQVVLCLVEFYYFLSNESFNQLIDQFPEDKQKLVNIYIKKSN